MLNSKTIIMRGNFITLALIFSMIFIFIASFAQAAENHKARVIAHSDKEVKDAEQKGCKKVREAKTLKALECSQSAASELGLQEDIQVFAVDSGANTQIKADLVQ